MVATSALRTPRSEGADEPHDCHGDQDVKWAQITRQRQRHQGSGQQRIARPHHGEQIAVADAVAHDAEHRGDQGPGVTERGKQGQQQDRSGLDQHIPAKNKRLHFESPRCEQIGGPLEAIVPGTEGCERGQPRQLAQISMPRFIAFHPALFLVGTRVTASQHRGPAPIPSGKVAPQMSKVSEAQQRESISRPGIIG